MSAPIDLSTLHMDTALLSSLQKAKSLLWLNPNLCKVKDFESEQLHYKDLLEAAKFMQKYAPCITQIFPETTKDKGRIQSPLFEIERFKKKQFGHQLKGQLLLKGDHALAVAGSIKARGGFFEVLQFAHQLCVEQKLIGDDEVADFTNKEVKKLLAKYTIGVGSTGNLGLSIGIISAKLGFKAKVYMSHDAKAWKKELLRKNGAEVIEEDGDFSKAISQGRHETLANPFGYFVDDERSKLLFLGYSLAAIELKEQLEEKNIKIDEEHPLMVYSPCGVGGSPGGVMWGLKMVFGDAVHVFMVEPTHAPAVLLGIASGLQNQICVQDIGLDNLTEADGLAVGRASAFASSFIAKLVSGIYTLADHELIPLLQQLYQSENIFVEPSATVGLVGPAIVGKSDYMTKQGIKAQQVCHVVWSTGGGLVPRSTRKALLPN